MGEQVTLLVGTKKGMYTLQSDDGRAKWSVDGPRWSPAPVYHATRDPRDGSLYAAVNSTWGGARIEYSRDMGKTWQASKNPAFPEGTGRTFYQTWHIEPGHRSTPNVMWAGVEPAALFKSEDCGESWSLVRSLEEHPSRPKWQPGFGGLGLHSIAIDAKDPKRMSLGISSAGVFTTSDGGGTWDQDNTTHGSERPDVFLCIHKLLAHPEVSGLRFMRVHEEVYWREPEQTTWEYRTPGLPTNFGFAAAIHPRDRSTGYVIPLDPMERTAPDPGIAVYRTRNRGESWERLDTGLPRAPLSVVREGMATDRQDPLGVYFGTANGEIYASRDEGESWERIAQYLPYVVSVHAATVD